MSTDGCAFHFEYPWPHNDLDPGCQFTDETEFFGCDGESYCRFHLPLAHKEGDPTPKGAWNETEVEAFQATIARLLEPRENETDETPVNLSGVVLPGEIDLSGRELAGVLWYRALFSAGANFKEAVFKGQAVFQGARFTRGTAEFRGAQFTGGEADFRGAQFMRAFACFLGTQFKVGGADFEDAQFGYHAVFRGAEFTSASANFEGAQFMGGEADFEDARFTAGSAYFKAAHFTGGRANFRYAQFTGGQADFEGTQFTGGYADFMRAQFAWGARFGWSKQRTSRSVLMGHSASSNEAQAETCGDFRELYFINVHVQGEADFSDRAFTKAANFSGTVFEKAPTFHGCQIHQGTKWLKSQFPERSGHDAEKAYRTLRLAMEQIRDRPQEAIFFALEQESMRNNSNRWDLRRWFSLAYEWTCGYGNSLSRPLLWLVGTTALFFVLYWIVDGGRDPTIDPVQAIITFCVQQIVRPFWIWSGSTPDLAGLFGDPLPIWIKLLATLQSILSLAFIGLFILVLRWQFRRA